MYWHLITQFRVYARSLMPNLDLQFKNIPNIVTVNHAMQGNWTGKVVIDLNFPKLFTVSQQGNDINCLVILISKCVKIMLRYFYFKELRVSVRNQFIKALTK